MPRMNILNRSEQRDFDRPPLFDAEARKSVFDLSEGVIRLSEKLRSPSNQVIFLLQAGYFRVAKSFFLLEHFHERDVIYVAQRVGVDPDSVRLEDYPKQTAHRHREMILGYYGFSPYDKRAEASIGLEISSMVASQLKPKQIFLRCVDILSSRRIEIPRYFRLSKLILKGLNTHKKKLLEVLESEISLENKQLLDGLLEPSNESGSRYKLTLLKKISQSVQPKKIRKSIEDFENVRELFESLKPLVSKLKLSPDAIQYFAQSVIRTSSFEFMRKDEPFRYLHFLAFIIQQYYSRQDTLVDVFLVAHKSVTNAVLTAHKEHCYETRKAHQKTIQTMRGNMAASVAFIEDVSEAAYNTGLPDNKKIERIRELLSDIETIKQESETLQDGLEKQTKDDDYARLLEEASLRLQNRVGRIIRHIQIQIDPKASALKEAIEAYKSDGGSYRGTPPLDFLTQEEREAVCTEKFRVSLYKAYLFDHIAKAIRSGCINLAHSFNYRPLDDYMYGKALWKKDREKLLKRAGMLALSDVKEVLVELKERVLHQFYITNRNLASGLNPHVKVTDKDYIIIHTPKVEKEETQHPLKECLPSNHYIALPEVLATIDRHCGFLDCFEHWKQQHVRKKPRKKAFIAVIAALGCGIGTKKIQRISQQLNSRELERVQNWYFHKDSLQAANECLLEFMNELELPNIHRKNPDQLHTSSDGQRYTVRGESLNASCSFKYTGNQKGSTVCSFIDEREFLFHTLVMCPAQRESAYTIDGLMHNEVIKSDIHSTDTHGFSEVIFAVTHLLGISFAPRIKKIGKKHIRIFKDSIKPDQKDWIIKPKGTFNEERIELVWEDILRFIVTIKLKYATASDLFRRLNSYSKEHDLYSGLKAFGRIINSDFILRWTDILPLRQAVQKQLNIVEHSNNFSHALNVENTREITQTLKGEQQIAQACRQLIKNALVCWNYLYYTQEINNEPNHEKRQQMIEALKNHSMAIWEHFNFLGEYDFSDEKLEDSVGIHPPKPLGIFDGKDRGDEK